MDIKDGSRDITINVPEGMQISDIYAYSRGNLPDNVQRWEAPLYGMTDILVFSTHADDEILFLGGVLTMAVSKILMYRLPICAISFSLNL